MENTVLGWLFNCHFAVHVKKNTTNTKNYNKIAIENKAEQYFQQPTKIKKEKKKIEKEKKNPFVL